jgi:hypothetical protein
MGLCENLGDELLHDVHCSLVVLGPNNEVAPTVPGQQRLVANIEYNRSHRK